MLGTNMKKKMESQMAKAGDVVVIYGRTKYDRELVTFTDAKDLVSYFRERDDPSGETTNNEDYMRNVGARLREAYEVDAALLPLHSEEAFVAALFRLGLCSITTLN